MVAIRPSTFIWFGILVLSSFSVGKGQSQGGEELEAATIGPFEKLSKNPVFLHFFFSPDGKLVAGSDSGLTLWNATDGKFVAKLEKRFFDTHWMAFSNSGRILATYNEEFGKVKNNRFGKISIWDVKARKVHTSFAIPGVISSDEPSVSRIERGLALTSDGRRLIACSAEPTLVKAEITASGGQAFDVFRIQSDLRAWDCTNGRELWAAPVPNVRAIFLKPDNKTLVAMTQVREVVDGKPKDTSGVKWLEIDVETGTTVRDLSGPKLSPFEEYFLIDGGQRLAVCNGEKLTAIDLATGQNAQTLTFENPPSGVFGKLDLLPFPDGKTAIRINIDYLDMIDLSNGKILAAQRIPFSALDGKDMILSPDLKKCIATRHLTPVLIDLEKLLKPVGK